ncbi:MAG: hypothetical protein AAF993_02190 [Pseudomonadota bacterium]
MGVVVLTLATSLFLGGMLWFLLGSRWRFSTDEQQNELLNFFAYFSGTLPVSFVLIFFGLGG